MPQAESAKPLASSTQHTILEDSDDGDHSDVLSSMSISQTVPSLKRKRSDIGQSAWNDQIVILVGTREYKLTVHTHIVRKIPFFRGCLDAPMVESQTRVVRMLEDDPLAVEGLVHWAYTGKLEYDLQQERKKYADDSSMRRSFTSRSVQLYALAKKCMVEDLQNEVINAIIVAHEHIRCPALPTIEEIIDLTEDDDPLRLYAMQRWSEFVHKNHGWVQMKKSNHSHYKDFAAQALENMEFAIDALARFPEGRRNGKHALAIDKCVWHTHTDTTKCSERKSKP